MSEKAVERACDQLVAVLGGDLVRFSQARATNQTRGIADRRYRLSGFAFWFEAKTATGKLYVDQYDFAVAEIARGALYAVGGVPELREFALALRRGHATALRVGEQQLMERRLLGLTPRQASKKRQPLAGVRAGYEALVAAHPERFPAAAAYLAGRR